MKESSHLFLLVTDDAIMGRVFVLGSTRFLRAHQRRGYTDSHYSSRGNYNFDSYFFTFSIMYSIIILESYVGRERRRRR